MQSFQKGKFSSDPILKLEQQGHHDCAFRRASIKRAATTTVGRIRLDSHLRRQRSKCQLCVGAGWGGGRGVLFTAPTRRQFGIFILPPSSTERQLSNSFQCVKSNLYSLAGCNIWVLNKEEDTNVWPSLKRVPHTGVENGSRGGSSTQLMVLGDSHRSHGFWGCPLRRLGDRGTDGRDRLEGMFPSTCPTGWGDADSVYMAGGGWGAEGTLHPWAWTIHAAMLLPYAFLLHHFHKV